MKKNTKFLFFTGGVISGIGKGVSVASLSKCLIARGYKVFIQKFDPYYNVDPGTMSPYQHGEVFVTYDGGETDLDLGHYERFTEQKMTKKSNYTQGRLFKDLLQEEREGKYGGNTIQAIPHVTNKIIEKLQQSEQENDVDFIITEIGGTVGDLESQVFFQAIWEFYNLNKDRTYFIHCSYLPFLNTSQEFKTKPTQHSIKLLNTMGIIPNMVLLRTEKESIDKHILEKISKTTFIPLHSCIPVPNLSHIYNLPLYLEEYNMAQIILKFFKMKTKTPDFKKWKQFINLLNTEKQKEINLAMVGKYIEYLDAYKSIIEALKIASIWKQIKINFHWINSSKITEKNIDKSFENIDGIVILPGFGERGFVGKILIAKYTREKNIPTLGICLGFQAMVIAQAQLVGIKNATSSEMSKTGDFVIDIVRGKKINDNLGGTLRLGEFKTIFKENSLIEKIYQNKFSFERHRHRYEVNPKYLKKIENKEFIFSGFDFDNHYAEICEVSSLKFYVGLQAHPEFNATPLKSHPLFDAFLDSILV